MPDDTEYLYSSFESYKTAVDDGSIAEKFADFFAPKLVGDADVESSSIQSQFSFAQYMHTELGHYQKVTGELGCLTVNGMTSEQSLVAFHIQYESTNNHWLMNDIDVSLMESVDELKEQALCPDEVRII